MNIFKNFLKILKSKYWIIWILLGLIIMLLPTYFFTWKERHWMIMWMWDNHFYFVLSLDIILAILFAIFVWATLYKMKYFWNPNPSKLWFLWWFLWSLVWGCASCSITLASYLGLASFMAFLPYGGIELKILSILLLIYVWFTTLKNLEVCNLKSKKS